MPRTPNNDSPNDMDNTNSSDDVTAVRSARAAQDRDNRMRDDRLREEEGRFAGNRQTRSRDDDTGGGRGRGWFGDPQGHAQAGSRSHDNTRGASRNQAYDNDDDRYGRRDAEGRFAGGRNQSDDEADFGAWHAYGHNRGWHGYQRRDNADMSPNTNQDRNDQNRSASGRGVDYDDVRSYAGRGQDYSRSTRGRDYEEDDDDRRMTSQGDSRPRDQEGRFTSHRH